MAPEQVSADPQVDHRVDLYAWVCLAYELLTGATPFGHRTPSAVYAAHLTETPTPVAVHRADAPPALAALVMQCLAKDPAARPASARSLVAVLEGVGTPSAIVAPRTTQPMNRTRAVVVGVIVLLAVVGGWQAVRWRGSRTATERAALGATSPATAMAVLLFENGSKDSTFDYFAEGLSDDVHSQLTQVQGLQVKARGSSMALHARGLEPREIGRTLAVTAVLSGVVRRSPDRVGITAEPVNVSTGDAMWSRTFDVPARDVVPLRDSLASAIAVALRGKLAPVASASAPALDPGTYDLLLRARYAADRSNFPRALENLQAALARSPGSPEVNAMLATVYVAFAATGVDKSDFLLTLAQQAAERAARHDPQSLAALRARTAVLRAQFQFPESYETIRQAAARDSSDIGLLLSASNSAWLVGRLDKIPLFAARALRVDPMNVQVFVISQYSAILRRDYRSALQFGARVLEVDPTTSLVSRTTPRRICSLARSTARWSTPVALRREACMATTCPWSSCSPPRGSGPPSIPSALS